AEWQDKRCRPTGSRWELAMSSIHLTPADRQRFLGCYRRAIEPEGSPRAHLLLLVDAGNPWATIRAVLFCLSSTIHPGRKKREKKGKKERKGNREKKRGKRKECQAGIGRSGIYGRGTPPSGNGFI